MGFLKNIIERYRKHVKEREEACIDLIFQIDHALDNLKVMFSDKQAFIDQSKEVEWRHENGKLFADLDVNTIQKFKKTYNYRILCDKRSVLVEAAQRLPNHINQHNERFVSMKIQSAYALIGNVEGRRLDMQQMGCIVKDAHNHLVVAGAGTGKTTTVIGKIKYLLKTGKCLPEDILVLSFTNASATEMKERIFAETGYQIAASTFHKLGINIISQVNGVMPKITQLNLRKFIKEQFSLNMQSEAYLDLLGCYLLYNRVVTKSEFEFKTDEEYDEYLKLNPPTTVNNVIVKSYGEMDIANFLTQNQVRYIYEHPYEIDTRTSEHNQYRPDFYLPDYNIYIEYFGINRNGEVPSYFKSENGKSASEVYISSMKWKRDLHSKNNTTMIECYAYEKLEGNLIDSLREKLEAASVVLNQKSSKELWMQITQEDDSLLDGVIELFETLINLIKSNGYNIATVRNLERTGSNVQKNNRLLSLLEPIFDTYCKYLTEHDEVDFNDMINLASKYIRQGKYINPYKIVIVDEYQDISKSRFELLNSLRKSKDYELFCVGDDWQSIYRFAGSDIGFILNFAKYWGPTEISKIETTYRFTQKLIAVSGGFVMQNPMQIKKDIKGIAKDVEFPLQEISAYTDKNSIRFMAQEIDEIPEGNTVFLIGRYSFDVKALEDSGLFSCCYNNQSGHIDVKYSSRPDLKIVFLTAHRSKGLQADYVFIINNKRSKMGFPSKIQDAPILKLLLDNCDQYPYAEERRLFYVAMTRAKKKVYIVTVDGQESEFAMELKKRYGDRLRRQLECPKCGGFLIKHSGPYGDFWGCSNYRKSGCNYKRNISSNKK